MQCTAAAASELAEDAETSWSSGKIDIIIVVSGVKHGDIHGVVSEFAVRFIDELRA